MFGVDSTEFLIIVIVAIVVIGPKDLPRALYKLGQVMGKARAMGRHFRSGLDAMVREAELEELQKQWDKENSRIMADHPSPEPVMTEKALVDGEHEPAPALDPDAEVVKALSSPAPDAFDPPTFDDGAPAQATAVEEAPAEQAKGASA